MHGVVADVDERGRVSWNIPPDSSSRSAAYAEAAHDSEAELVRAATAYTLALLSAGVEPLAAEACEGMFFEAWLKLDAKAIGIDDREAHAGDRDVIRMIATEIERNHPVASRRAKLVAELKKRGHMQADAKRLAEAAIPDPDAATPAEPPDWCEAFPTLAESGQAREYTEPIARMLAWPGHTTAAHGHAGSGKSRVLADAAAAVTRGDRWLQRQTVDGGGVVLWLAFEDMSGARSMLQHHNADLTRTRVGDGSLLVGDDWPDRLRKLVEAARPAWIIVDSFASLAAAAGIDSNNADEVTRLLQPLNVAAKGGAAVTITHHQPHEAERLRNSSAIGAAVDAVVGVTLDEASRVTTIKRTTKIRFELEHDRVMEARLALSDDRFELLTDPTVTGGGGTNGSGGTGDHEELVTTYLMTHGKRPCVTLRWRSVCRMGGGATPL